MAACDGILSMFIPSDSERTISSETGNERSEVIIVNLPLELECFRMSSVTSFNISTVGLSRHETHKSTFISSFNNKPFMAFYLCHELGEAYLQPIHNRIVKMSVAGQVARTVPSSKPIPLA